MIDNIQILDTSDVSSLSCDNVPSLDLSYHSLRCTTQSDFIYLRDMVSNIYLSDDNKIWEGNYDII